MDSAAGSEIFLECCMGGEAGSGKFMYARELGQFRWLLKCCIDVANGCIGLHFCCIGLHLCCIGLHRVALGNTGKNPNGDRDGAKPRRRREGRCSGSMRKWNMWKAYRTFHSVPLWSILGGGSEMKWDISGSRRGRDFALLNTGH